MRTQTDWNSVCPRRKAGVRIPLVEPQVECRPSAGHLEPLGGYLSTSHPKIPPLLNFFQFNPFITIGISKCGRKLGQRVLLHVESLVNIQSKGIPDLIIRVIQGSLQIFWLQGEASRGSRSCI